MLKGIPASGKSTWAKEKAKDGRYKRINKDDLRAMIDGGKWSRSNEKKIIEIRNLMIDNFLEGGFHVIVDDTNFNPSHESALRAIAKRHNALFETKLFDVDLQEAIKRDLQRQNSVGEKVIKDMYYKYVHKVEPIEQDYNLPQAVIFDIDGTLAKMHNRSPYDWDKVMLDKRNAAVFKMYLALQAQGYKILICTGRDGVCEQKTREWLTMNGIFFDEFMIRPEGNMEKDSIIKQRMLDDLVQRYNIVGVFDDRDQVVEMWRQNGLTCFQVDYGNF